MSVTPKTHAQQVRRGVERRSAVSPSGSRLAYSTTTGQARTVNNHEHVMDEVEADLAGGVTIGYCHCGEYIRNEGI